ncbi:hypothetical protein DVW02_15930 [Clostridium botulinum]|nr:hypothetical protein [Clostridium botulinum]
MEKKYLNEIIKEDYKNWKIGDLIFIKAGTGCGKSYFVKNELNKWCAENGQYILFLTNRCTLKDQVENDIGDFSNITVKNYQEIEELIINDRLNITNFKYVVMDEAHYFFTDSAFNRRTDLFFNKMLENTGICKILMTATPRLLSWYFNNKEININYTYELKPNYTYLNKVTMFKNYETISGIIEEIPKDEQIILFSSAKRALEIAQKYKGAFICSKYNKDKLYDKYVKGTKNEKELELIIKQGRFNNHLLCTTTALDNGVNINEGVPVKHIIIDVFDRDEFVQCLGRKRVNENEKVNLYFYGWTDNTRINGFKTKISNSLERAEYLNEYGDIKYTKMNFKSKFTDARIIDDIIENGQIRKVVNECMYQKYKCDMLMYNAILNKEGTDKYITYKTIIALALQMNHKDIECTEIEEIKLSLEETLDSLVGKKLYKEERKELIEFFNIRKDGKLLKGIGNLNAYLEESNIDFVIKKDTDWNRKLEDENKNPTYGKSYWMIYKLVA